MAQKKHFLCTHTWNSDDARQEALKFMEEMTDKDFLDLLRNAKAETLVEKAHQICPYSNATRGNIAVELSVI